MEKIILIVILLLSPIAQAVSICRGQAEMTHYFLPEPMTETREITVHVLPRLSECEEQLKHGPTPAFVSVDIGGDPIEFAQNISLDEKIPNVIRFENGDSFKVRLQILPENRLRFSLEGNPDPTGADMPLLKIQSVELDCE